MGGKEDDPLDGVIAVIEAGRKQLDHITKTFSDAAGTLAWQVGVIAPGLLGLLFNATSLSKNTKYSPETFKVLFVGSELCFSLAILCGILAHRQFATIAGKCAALSIGTAGIATMLIQRKQDPANKKLADDVDAAVDGLDTSDLPRKVADFAWWTRAAFELNDLFAVLGYVGFTSIMLAMSF